MKKLAIVISGAVSLGTYEAGVMYELLEVLEAHNTANPNDKIIIDVITGALAGGMNAVILAQKMLFQPSRLKDVTNNDLYLPWVKDVDLTDLLAKQSDESWTESILSSDLIVEVSNRYITDPYSAGGNLKPEEPHKAIGPKDPNPANNLAKIKLGLAMSNLNGIDYSIPLLSGGAMPYTRFQDQVIVEIDAMKEAHNTSDFWEPIRAAAVACGAFPFAFRVQELFRHSDEYQKPLPNPPLPNGPPPDPYAPNPRLPDGTLRYAYSDGGIFQNEPIALAKRLVDEIDGHTNDQRFYIFVAPGMKQSTAMPYSAGPGPSDFNYWNTGKALVNAIFNQARFRDLENVERINGRIREFDKQALGLNGLYLNGTVSSNSMNPATRPLLNALGQVGRTTGLHYLLERKRHFAAANRPCVAGWVTPAFGWLPAPYTPLPRRAHLHSGPHRSEFAPAPEPATSYRKTRGRTRPLSAWAESWARSRPPRRCRRVQAPAPQDSLLPNRTLRSIGSRSSHTPGTPACMPSR